MGAERAVLMLPLNVVMMARIKGHVDAEEMHAAVEKLRARHALLAVRVRIEADDKACYTTRDVPALPFKAIERRTDRQWFDTAVGELKASFPMDVGPLVRFTLLQSEDVSELIVCGHHAICDGISLAYLIRDILEHTANPSKPVERLPSPPAVDRETGPTPPSTGFLARALIGLMNRAWRRKKLRFDFDSMEALHERYWERNAGARLLAWQLSESETARLVARCREEGVTVNSALWAAFLTVQHEVQGSGERFRSRAGLAISTRDMLKLPVGESFGFYASSHKVHLKHYLDRPFWDAARKVHEQLKSSIASANPFRMLSATLLDPTLLDSLYFSKYGLARNGMSERLLKKMMWEKVNFGFAITNVGRVDVPVAYGNLELDAVYGPCVYSDVNEKTVGVITVGNKATFVMSYNETVVDTGTGKLLKDGVVARIGDVDAYRVRHGAP